jgi:hypothetical protein
MDGILMNALHGNCHHLSDENLKKLVNYYKTGILSTHDRNLLLKQITDATGISPEQHSPAPPNSILYHVTT